MSIAKAAPRFKPSSIKSAALAYGRAGFKIYPSPRKDGAAYVKWSTASTSDAATIEAWWTKWPDALICLDCGKSEIGVIDVDTLEGHNVDGPQSLLDLEMENGFLPKTRQAQSPSKGVHYFFRDPGAKLKTTSGKLGKGLDTRGRGGMVVLTPSVVKGKGVYQWLNKEKMAPIPQWVLDIVGAPNDQGTAPDAEFEPVYTQDEFKERLNLLNVDNFRAHDKWLSLLLACTHSSTVLDGKEAFMDWTTGKGMGEYAGDEDIISDRWDINYRNGRNKTGRGAAKVGTFNKFLTDAGLGDRVQQQPEISAADDFDDDPPNFTPPGKWDKAKKAYVKPDPDELKKMISDQRSARKETRRLNAILGQYTLCTSPVAFIAADSTALVSKATFSARYNPFTARMSIPARYKDDAAKYVISLPFGMIERVDGLCYRPGDERRIVDRKANMWVAPPITRLDEEPKILLDHIAYLIPNEVERKLVLDWLAHCVQKPMVKLMFALLIVDAKGGTGKSWFGMLMRVLLGRPNVLMIGKDNKVDAKFNAKFFNKAFTFIHEALPNGKTNLVDALKDQITEDTIWIEPKGVDEFLAENRNNIMALTNHANALKILLSNRRWAVAMGTTDVRFCDDAGDPTPKTVAYYEKLFACIGTPEEPGDEARRALNFFMERELSSFKGQSLAPHTEAKGEVAEATQGSWSSFLGGAKVDKAEPFTRELFTAAEALAVLAKNFEAAKSANARTPALSDALIECGCRKITKQVRTGGKQVRLWTLSPGLLKKYDKKAPPDVAKLYEEMCAADPVEVLGDFDAGDDAPSVELEDMLS